MRDIYNRDPQDPNYVPNILEVTDPIEICVGQLKMMLLTDKGEVLGDPKFGIAFESLIFELNLSQDSIRKELDLHLSTYYIAVCDVWLLYRSLLKPYEAFFPDPIHLFRISS